MKRNTQKYFEKDYKLTIGVDIFSQEVNLHSGAETIYLSIWDVNRSERFRFFRHSFYRGSVGALIILDVTSRASYQQAIKIIQEIQNSAGSIPIFLFSNYSSGERVINYSEIDELNKKFPCLYFENPDVNTLWVTLADEMFQFITGLSIENPQYRTYIESYKKSKILLHSMLKSLGFKIIDNKVDILNKHGIFSVDINNGKTYFESISCSDCKTRRKCTSEKRRKKFICIIQKSDFPGWTNSDLLMEDMLILSKIIAVSEDNLPKDVYVQMNRPISQCEV